MFFFNLRTKKGHLQKQMINKFGEHVPTDEAVKTQKPGMSRTKIRGFNDNSNMIRQYQLIKQKDKINEEEQH